MQMVFPNEPEYRLQLLDPSHPIWHAEEKVAADQLRPLLGIEFGCRTSVVYAPPDPPTIRARRSLPLGAWPQRAGDRQFSPAVQAQIDAARQIGVNVLAYATNREVKWKDDIPDDRRPSGRRDDKRRAGKDFRGQAPPSRRLRRRPAGAGEPDGGGRRAIEALRVDLHPATIGHHRPGPVGPPHGLHARPQQLPSDRRGAGGPADVRRSRRRGAGRRDLRQPGVRRILPPRNGGDVSRPSRCERIPASDPLFTTTYGGFDLAQVSRRDPQPAGTNGPLSGRVRRVPPELEGIRLHDRYGVIFSQFDLSCALEKRDSLECRGYTREDAARIALNVLLYALH